MSSKRPRKSASSASDASKDSLSSSPPTQLSPKAARRGSLTSTKSPTKAISCTLPPTCNPPNPATILPSSKEFEKHYSLYHTHVCTAPEVKRHATSAREGICGKVFPDARLLDLVSRLRTETPPSTSSADKRHSLCSYAYSICLNAMTP